MEAARLTTQSVLLARTRVAAPSADPSGLPDCLARQIHSKTQYRSTLPVITVILHTITPATVMFGSSASPFAIRWPLLLGRL